jgi:putative glutamine amidotransferase
VTQVGPIIGITADLSDSRLQLSPGYAKAVVRAGGTPIVLPPVLDAAPTLLAVCHGLILSGGDDPIMTDWGRPTHPGARKVTPLRQEFDLALYRLACERDLPVLGVCLGMQFMGLEAGGELDQHLPDSWPTAEMHLAGRQHDVSGTLGAGSVHSRHHQAMRSSGSFDVVATASDGLIEAIADPTANFRLGVQWHPERSGDGPLGATIFRQLVVAAESVQHVTS